MKPKFTKEELERMGRCCKAKSRFLLHMKGVIPFDTFTDEQLVVLKRYYEYGYYAGYRRALKDRKKVGA